MRTSSILLATLLSTAACKGDDAADAGTDGGTGMGGTDSDASTSQTSGVDATSGGPTSELPNYSGVYVRDGLAGTGGAACEGAERFEIIQRGPLLFVSTRSTTCEGSPGPAGEDPIGPLIIGPDGTLYDRGRVAGDLSEDALSFSAIVPYGGCVEGTVSFDLLRQSGDTFTYEENSNGCGQAVAFDGAATLQDAPLVIPSAGGYQAHVATAGTTSSLEVTFENIGNAAATGLSISGPDPVAEATRGFVGGTSPGTGGTCGSSLDPGETCTVVVELGTPTPAVVPLPLGYVYAESESSRSMTIEQLAFTDPSAAIDVGVDQFLTAACTLASDGAVECITPFTFDGDIRVVPPLSNPTAIDVSSQAACALDDAGLQCWGSLSLTDYGGPGLIGLDFDAGLACAHFEGAQAPLCVSNGDEPSQPPAGGVTDVATGAFLACFVVDGEAVCGVRGDDFYEVPIPTDLGPVGEIGVGTVWVCAVTDDGMRCFDKEGEATVPAGLDGARELEMFGPVACADVAGDLRCWGSAALTLPGVGPVTGLDLAARIGCHAGPSGVECFTPFVPWPAI